MKDFLTWFPFKKLSIFVTVIVCFIYNFLTFRYMDDTCKDEAHDCYLYMGLPFGSIFLVLLWTDKMFMRICKYTCACTCKRKYSWRCCTTCCSPCCSAKCCGIFVVLFSHIVKAALVGLLWVVSVLLNGDWWICCWRHHSTKWSQLADKSTYSSEYRQLRTDLKNDSQIMGFSLLLMIIFLAFLLALCGQSKCGCCDRLVYEQKILEEEENVLETLLREEAKKKLTDIIIEKIKDGKWNECLDIAEELIDAVPPTPEEQQNEFFLNQESFGGRQDETNVDEN